MINKGMVNKKMSNAGECCAENSTGVKSQRTMGDHFRWARALNSGLWAEL